MSAGAEPSWVADLRAGPGPLLWDWRAGRDASSGRAAHDGPFWSCHGGPESLGAYVCRVSDGRLAAAVFAGPGVAGGAYGRGDLAAQGSVGAGLAVQPMGDLARSVGCGGLARVRVGFRAGLRIPAWYRVEGRIRGTTGDSATSEVRVIDVGTGGVVLEADSDWSRGEPAVVPRPVAPLDGERPLPTAVKRLAELHGVLDRHSVPARFQTMAQKGTVVWAEMLPRGAVASRAQSQLRNASFLFRPDGTIKGYRRFLEVSTPETTDVFLEVAGPQMADRSGAIHPFLLCAASDNACAPITCFAADGVTVTRELEFAVAPGWHGFASGSGGWIHVRGVAGPDSVRGRRVDAAFEIVGAETGEVLATGRAHFVKVASFDGTPPKI